MIKKSFIFASKQSKPSFLLRLILLFVVFNFALSQTIVKTLPGYNGTLPFKLETGYVSVGEDDEVQLFYYFVESERNPVNDPLVLWLSGGPGCSGFSSLAYGKGPLFFEGSSPSFVLNPYSWTKVANIIFIDSPVGAGFSYSTTAEGYNSSDTKTAQGAYTFLQKWLLKHPIFLKNRLYIGGDSYGGKMVGLVTAEITRGNEANVMPQMNLKGFYVGNGIIDSNFGDNDAIPYAHRMGLISDQYYKLAESSCNGEYESPDPENKQCLYALQLIHMCIDKIYKPHILEPSCGSSLPDLNGLKGFSEDDSSAILFRSDGRKEPQCRSNNYVADYVWANDPTVQEALQVRKGTKETWIRCDHSLPYEQNVKSAVSYYQYLSKRNYEALFYSGDHDMAVPYTNTLKIIGQLNLTPNENWRPWLVNGEIAGYTEKFKKNGFSLTFATVKGGGHTAPEYKPKECYAMVNRWLSAQELYMEG